MTEPAPRSVKPTEAPFFRFDARLGWPLGPVESRPGMPHDDRDLQLAVAGQSAIPLAEPFGSFGGRTLPRGLAISGAGRVFLADPAHRVILTATVDAAARPRPKDAPASWPFAPLWPARPLPETPGDGALGPASRPADPYTLVRPVDVGLAPGGDLVIVDAGAARVLVLAFPTARLRHVLDLAPGGPSALAFDAGGRAHVADPVAGTIHRFDRYWRHDPDYPRAALSAPAFLAAAAAGRGDLGGDCRCGCDGPSGCTCPADGPCDAVPERRALIHVLDNGTLVGLDGQGRTVPGTEADLALSPPPLIPTETGLAWRDPALPGRDPIRIDGIALAPDGRHRGSGLPLRAVPRRIEVPRFGTATTTALDSGQTGFAWDRIALAVTLPETTRLVVSTLTSEVEIPFDRLATLPPERWSAPLAIEPGDAPEVLVQSAAGRYLWLRIEMSGDGTVSPRIAEIDVFGPRRSAMRFLPASFHQDPDSVRFLDRYLSYFDTVFAEITAANRDIAALFDPRVVPDAFLPWLGSWFDLEFLATWPENLRREMIAQAVSYYRMRGTVAGLQRILQWHTGLRPPLPQVIEHFRLPAGDPAMVGGAALDPGSAAHAFTIVMPAHAAPAAERPVLDRLIAASVPAHTRWQLRLCDPGVTVAAQSTVGVDMVLGPSGGAPLGAGRLGTTLATAPPRPPAPVHDPYPISSRQTAGGPPC